MPGKKRDTRPAQYAAALIKGKSKTAAALEAGYSSHQARNSSETIDRRPNVQRALNRVVQRAELTVDRTLEEVRRLAFSDVRKLFDEHGNLRPIHTLSDEDASMIAGIEVIIKNAEAGDGVTDKVHKIKIWDKPKSLEQLLRYFKLIDNTINVNVTVATIEQRLAAGRQRWLDAQIVSDEPKT